MEELYYLCSIIKALISCAVTMQLISAFVLAYTKSRFSHDKALLKVIYKGFSNCCPVLYASEKSSRKHMLKTALENSN